jgi:TrbL/VirB6 plasmid conjugal transfer protein
MNDFNSIFPNFVNQAVQLKQILTPVAFVMITGGMISSIVTGQKSGNAYTRIIARTLVLIMVLTFLVAWGNTLTTIVDSTVKNVLHVDPTQIFNQYRAALDMQKSSDTTTSWWEKVFSIRATIFESLISAFLWCLSWVASAIVFFAYIVQKIILYMGYALAPIFIGFFAFASLYDIAKRYFLNLVGVMLWPLGWGIAGLVTQGLIDFMTDRSFLHTSVVMVGYVPTTGSDAYNFQNFIGAALLGIWLIFSTIAAPVIIGKSLTGNFLAGSALMSGAARAGRAGVTSAVTTGASIAAGGGGWAAAAGAIAGAGAGLESLVATSADMGSGSLIGSLTAMRPRSNGDGGTGGQGGSGKNRGSGGANGGGGGQGNPPPPVANPPFASDDLTGAKAVGEILKRVKK